MVALRDVEVPPLSPARLEPVIGAARVAELLRAADIARAELAGNAVWNVNSTATGGGVAEMLQVLVGYVAGLGLDIRWTVIGGDPDFFAVTKRLHNRLHGQQGDLGPLGPAEAAHYATVLAEDGRRLVDRVRPGDVVILHDPQTAGLARELTSAGAAVVWRCHIGADHRNALTDEAWGFLRPHLADARALVFSRRAYVPEWVPDDRAWVIAPSIDPLSPKNQDLDPATVAAIVARIGLVEDGTGGSTTFVRRDGRAGEVVRRATVLAEALPTPGDPLVVQVSRWDRLKDMLGVLRGFAEHVTPDGPGFLALVGPDVSGVTDDPEGAGVYAGCVAEWRSLPQAVRGRVLLVTLPLDDVDENAAMVNAIQRRAHVVVQKSLAEGFGLTVAEAMWKGRPVVGSAVGGIQDQLSADGTGILLADPHDLAGFGAAVRRLLDRPAEAARIGANAREHVRGCYLGDRHLLQYAELVRALTGAPAGSG